MNEFLPEPLPTTPLPLFRQWFSEARSQSGLPNPDAMVLATVGAQSAPSARVVLCKRLDDVEGFVVFYTNFTSRKGRELTAHPRAAAVFHWDSLQRQIRIEGPVIRSPVSESDEYFATRPLLSRLGAWASEQSQPLASRGQLALRMEEFAQRFSITKDRMDAEVPRPPHWGGHRLWIDTLELWVEGPGRTHDRAVWTRTLDRRDEFSFSGSEWSATRLNP